MNIGPIIRKLRKERGIAMRKFAKMTGVCPTTIHNVETGKNKNNCTISTAQQIAHALGLKTSELVRLAEENL